MVPGGRIVGLMGRHEGGDGMAANGSGGPRHDGGIVVVPIPVIIVTRVVSRRVIVRPAIIAVARGERAADHGTGDRAGEIAAATAAMTVAAVPASAIAAAVTRDGGRATAEARAGCGAAPTRGEAATEVHR